MNYLKTTKKYYAKWLGVKPEKLDKTGIFFSEHADRDKKQKGYGAIFGIWCYITSELIIVSYSKRYAKEIEELRNILKIGMAVKEVKTVFEKVLKTKVGHGYKFCFDKINNNINTSNVLKLEAENYPRYKEFFYAQHPNYRPDDEYLQSYFNDISGKNYAFAVSADNKYVSVTDAPSMPYLEDEVQEIGINTLTEYRCRGYAKQVSAACVKSIIKSGRCPQWSCAASNIGSEKLAYSVGYKKLADFLTVTIKE